MSARLIRPRYELMLKCWKEEPHERPPFLELVKEFDAMLQVGMDYLDLNCFMVTNREYFVSADTVSGNAARRHQSSSFSRPAVEL